MNKNISEASRMIGKYFLIVAVFIFLAVNAVFADVITFEKEYTCEASEIDSEVSCRIIALKRVKGLLIEEIENYLESKSLTKDFQLTKDRLTTIIAGAVSVEIIDEKWEEKKYSVRAKISANSDTTVKIIDFISSDERKIRELETVEKKAADFFTELKRLKGELQAVKADSKEPGLKDKKIIDQYDEAAKKLGATYWFEQGYIAVITANHKETIDAFTKTIELDSGYTEAYRQRGIAYVMLSRFQEAVSDIDKVIEQNTKDSVAYFHRGVAYKELGRYSEAIRDLTSAVELSPDLQIHYNRGIAYIKIGKYLDAIKDFDKAIEQNPKNERNYYNRGVAYDGIGKYQEAIKDFDKAIEMFSGYALAYNGRGLAYGKSGKYKEAIKDFKKAIELNPKDAEAYYNRGVANFSLGKEKEAVNDFKKAAKLGHKGAQEYLKSRDIKWK